LRITVAGISGGLTSWTFKDFPHVENMMVVLDGNSRRVVLQLLIKEMRKKKRRILDDSFFLSMKKAFYWNDLSLCQCLQI
jgi:hypothetical protein